MFRAADKIASELLQEYLFGGDESTIAPRMRERFTIETVQELYELGMFE